MVRKSCFHFFYSHQNLTLIYYPRRWMIESGDGEEPSFKFFKFYRSRIIRGSTALSL